MIPEALKPETIEKHLADMNDECAEAEVLAGRIKSSVDILTGRQEAQEISECLLVAYYLHGRDSFGWKMHLHDAHKEFRNLARKLGYRVERIEP